MRKGIFVFLILFLSTTTVGVYAQNKAYRGQTVEIAGKVVDELGNGVSGAKVELRHGTEVLASTTSESDGSFSLSWDVPSDFSLGPKTLTIYVPEQPSSYIEEASTSISIEIWDGTTLELNSLPERIHRGDTFTISGVLSMMNGGGASDATITICCGQSELGSATTDVDGHFSFSFTVPNNWKRGPITITAEFAGSSSIYLDGSEDSESTALWIKPTILIESTSQG